MALDLSTLTAQQQLAAIYIGYYDRAADPVGEDFWESAVANPNLSLADIATDFATQPETLIAYPFLDAPTAEEAEGFIAEVFLNLFNRAPDAAGLEFWSGALLAAIAGDEGALTVGEIILAIIEGAQDSAEGNDRTTILNKIEVATSWTDAADAAAIDYATDSAAQNSAKSIIEGVTDEQSTVAAAKSTIDDFFEPAPVPGEEYLLTSATDVITGTADDDEFNAYIQQNPFAGGVSNSLSSADRLDGGAGNDRLYAELSFEFLGTNSLAVTDIQPRISGIEELDFEARDFGTEYFFGGELTKSGGEDGPDIIVDAKNITDHEEIGSYYSDGDLKIENLTTLTSGGSARNTSEITVTMDHTDNYNSDKDASDLTVLFDNDYLLSGQESEGQIFYFLLDEDAELANNPNRLNNIDVDGIRFTIDTGNGPVEVNIEAAEANVAGTHQGFVNALQAPLQALIADGTLPAGTTLTLDPSIIDFTFLDDGSRSDDIPAIVLTSGDGSPVIATGFSRIEEEIGEYDVYGRFNSINEVQDQPISIDIDLHKAGRGGEGGHLTVGGKVVEGGVAAGIAGGIELFNLNVMGGSEKPSWIGDLNSTLDALDTVIVTTDAAVRGSGDVADLTIGEIGGDNWNNGGNETDVRVFNSTAFEGDFTGTANLDEFGGGAHSYLLGGGDDNLTLILGDNDGTDNAIFGGGAGDSLLVNTGGGDDMLLVDNGNSSISSSGSDLEFLDIETGAGDDTVYYDADNANRGPLVSATDTTTGDGAMISTSAGEDRIYMNDGTVPNGYLELDITGIGDADNFEFFGASLQIEMDGVLSEWVDIDYDRTAYTTSREDIRDAILAAVASNSALEGMIQIIELADGTLQARSLVSGGSTFTIDLEGPVASNALVTAGTRDANFVATVDDGGEDEPFPIGDADAGWELLNAQPTLNQVGITELGNAWNAWNPGSTAFADTTAAGNWDSDNGQLAFDGVTSLDDSSVTTMLNNMDALADLLDITGALNGPNGNASDDNVINAGGDDDLIVLSTNAVSVGNFANTENGNGNTVEFTGQFGWDTIVNFTIGTAGTALTAAQIAQGQSGLNDNDVLDFFSYLDEAAAMRGTSIGAQTLRTAEAVDYSFLNQMGTADGTDDASGVIDHNQIRLVDFDDIWNGLEGVATGNGPSNFDSLSAADVDAWLELNFSATASVIAGSAAGGTGVGNTFLVLVGKDGDIEITIDNATESFDGSHADNQFWAFQAEVSSFTASPTTAGNNYDFTVDFLGGVDLADTLITGLTAEEFGIF